MTSRLPKLIFVALVVFAALYFSSEYAKLPETVATHFGASGRANGWQEKSDLMTTFVMLNVIPVLLVFGVPAILRALPPALVNIPNKQYWLSEERAEETHGFLGGWFGWFGCAVYGLMLYAYRYVIEWNLHRDAPPSGASLMLGIGLFALFTVVWIFRIPLHFGGKAGWS